MNMQNVKDLSITEGDVRTIHDSHGNLLWGRLAYDTKYAGDTEQDGNPFPDTPVPIQVVTGTQTVTVSDGVNSQDYTVNLSSKNLCNGVNQNYWLTTNCTGAGVTSGSNGLIIPVKSNTDYTISTTITQARYRVAYCDHTYSGSQITCYNGTNRYGTSDTITINSSTHKYLIIDATDLTKIQVEEGNQASSFEAYYNYELAKIGTYQDYIYKSGDDWYVHKETGKVTLDGTVGYWNYIVNRTNVTRIGVQSAALFGDYNTATTASALYSEYFKGGASYDVDTPCAGLYSASVFYMAIPNSIGTTAGSITQEGTLLYWINHTKPSFYLSLKNATDTQITDSTLIAQLNAIHEWLTRYGYNSTVSGNLPLLIEQTNLS